MSSSCSFLKGGLATTMASNSLLSIALAVTLPIFSPSAFSLTEAYNGGFSVDLIPRDSPQSPFYDPSLSPSQRLVNALRRSVSRANRFLSTSASPVTASTDVISDSGEYLMRISIGTPPVEVLAIADTGSDLIWTQCSPCIACYKQKAPFFDPRKSSTYKDLACDSRPCQSLEIGSCEQTCQYTVIYGDTSYSRGALAAETVTLSSTEGRPVSIPNVIFGCGKDNGGTFKYDGSGIVGLGGGEISLVSQMSTSIGGKFSYCLVPSPSHSTNTSKLNFGASGVVSGAGVVSTPLIPKHPPTYYYLTLEGISVGNQRLELHNSLSSLNATRPSVETNIIIDSGTTLTILPPDLYQQMIAAVTKAIPLKPVPDPQNFLDLCYAVGDKFDAPIITVHFTGADVKLNQLNTFSQTSDSVVCLAFTQAVDVPIYGNLAQMNFLIGYDLQKMTVSFKPTDCTQK